MIFRKIHRLARKTIRGNHLESVGIFKIGIKIVRKQQIRKLIVKQLTVENTPLRYQMSDADILIPRQIIDI